MKHIKWLYLVIWALIYQLPKRTVTVFSTLIVFATFCLFLWLFSNPHFVAGPIQEIYRLPGSNNVAIQVKMPIDTTTKLAVIDAHELPFDIEKAIWFLGFGENYHTLSGRFILLLDHYTVLGSSALVDPNDARQLLPLIRRIPHGILICGILMVLFGMLLLQAMTALMIGFIVLAASWHLMYLGNFLGFWWLSDFMIYPLCTILAVAGAALGMRTSTGWTAAICHRLSAIALVLLCVPLLSRQLALSGTESLFAVAILAACILPQTAYCAAGSSLISHELALNPSESVVILVISLGLAFWMRNHKQHTNQRYQSRPFRNRKPQDNGELPINSLFKGDAS